MLENNQKELILLKDLGMLYPKETSKFKRRYGIYKCHCGNEFKAQAADVQSGNVKSCTCNKGNKKHNLAHNRIYQVWADMMGRCNKPNNTAYKYYGARGIIVCDRWHDVKNFIEDMYPSYIEGLTIDREDNDLGYNPNNCRWVSRSIQSRNSRKLNRSNKSGYRGVHFTGKKWQTQIVVNNKGIYLGRFTDIIEASKAYDKYVIDNNLEHTRNFE